MVHATEKEAAQSLIETRRVPELLRQEVDAIYGQGFARQLVTAEMRGREARDARQHLPEGQLSQVRVQLDRFSQLPGADWQRYVHTVFPAEVRSSSTVFDIQRTSQRIPMQYGMPGYEAAHCTRSVNQDRPWEGSHIVITPDGDTPNLSNNVYTLNHEMAHSISPLDSPDMPLRTRFEVMKWEGHRVVQMEQTNPQILAAIPAGEGFLRFSYPMGIRTPDTQRRRQDRATEYWAELFATLMQTPQRGPGATWEDRAVAYLVLQVGSGIRGRDAAALQADAREHVRFMQRSLPAVHLDELSERFNTEWDRLRGERNKNENREFIRGHFFTHPVFADPYMRALVERGTLEGDIHSWDAWRLANLDSERIRSENYTAGNRSRELPLQVRDVISAVGILNRLHQSETGVVTRDLGDVEFEALIQTQALLEGTVLKWLVPAWRGDLPVEVLRFVESSSVETSLDAVQRTWQIHPSLKHALPRYREWVAQRQLPLETLEASERVIVERALAHLRENPSLLDDWTL